MVQAISALQRIFQNKAPFVTRGDRSGTHLAELRLWSEAGIDIVSVKEPWYRQIGQGMGATLNTAATMGAYVLSDRGTYVAWHHYDSLAIAVAAEPALFNQYGIIVVNPAKHPHIKRDLGQIFTDWMIGHDGQSAIASYRIGGQQLFFPNAKNRN